MRRLIHQRLRKLGMPAGQVRPVEPETPHEAYYSHLDFSQESLQLETVSRVEELAEVVERASCTWIDINGAHEVGGMQKIGEIFKLHPLTVEDILSTDQRPKLEEFENYIFLTIQKPTYRREEQRIDVEQVSLILTRNVVVSLAEPARRTSAPIYTRMLREKNRIKRLGTDYLAYVIVDFIVDEYFVTMERAEDQIQELEKSLVTEPSTETMQSIHALRQDMILLRKSVWPLREVVAQLASTESELFDEGIQVYLKDLSDHILQVIEVIEVYRDMTSGMLDIYLSTVGQKTNEIMKTLTMIASLFIPLTLITGIYGMNFVDMPELHWAFGYPMALGLMAIVAAGMLLYFKKKKWI
jgi:magnesium transporter